MKRLVLLAILGGGGTDPAQVAGTYTRDLTNRDNGCNYANWQVGNTASGIPVQFTQNGSSVSATVMGVAGGLLSLGLGLYLAYQIGVVQGLFTGNPIWSPS